MKGQMSRKEYKDKYNDFGTIGKIKEQMMNKINS